VPFIAGPDGAQRLQGQSVDVPDTARSLEAQAEPEKLADAGLPVPQLVRLIGEQHEVVHIPHVVADAERALHKLIERVEVGVREQLAREVPDGQAVVRPERAQSLVGRDAVESLGRTEATRRDRGLLPYPRGRAPARGRRGAALAQ
jgi:hypothetical protein